MMHCDNAALQVPELVQREEDDPCCLYPELQ